MAKVNGWLGALLRDKGQDIYRMKGVLAIRDAPAKFVFHAVHMQFDGTPHEPWAEGEERISKLIFIGKNLDRKALNEAFRACLADTNNAFDKCRAQKEALHAAFSAAR